MTMEFIHLNFFGLPVSVGSDDVGFVTMAAQSLSFFVDQKSQSRVFTGSRSITVRFETRKLCDPHEATKGMSRIGNSAFVQDGSYLYFYGHLMVRSTWGEQGLEVVAQHYGKPGLKGLIRRTALLGPYLNGRNAFLYIRYLILFPVFMMLELEKKISLLHGSAVNIGGKGVIFAGLASVGKSLLATALTMDHDCKFCADNFVLFDKEYVYPLPEFIRLSLDAKKRINNVERLGRVILSRHDRDYYSMKRPMVSGSVKPELLFILTRSQRTEVKSIEAAWALDQVLLANDHVREFPQHHLAGLLQFMNENVCNLYEERMGTFKEMLNKVRIFKLGVGDSLRPADDVRKVIDNVL